MSSTAPLGLMERGLVMLPIQEPNLYQQMDASLSFCRGNGLIADSDWNSFQQVALSPNGIDMEALRQVPDIARLTTIAKVDPKPVKPKWQKANKALVAQIGKKGIQPVEHDQLFRMLLNRILSPCLSSQVVGVASQIEESGMSVFKVLGRHGFPVSPVGSAAEFKDFMSAKLDRFVSFGTISRASAEQLVRSASQAVERTVQLRKCAEETLKAFTPAEVIRALDTCIGCIESGRPLPYSALSIVELCLATMGPESYLFPLQPNPLENEVIKSTLKYLRSMVELKHKVG